MVIHTLMRECDASWLEEVCSLYRLCHLPIRLTFWILVGPSLDGCSVGIFIAKEQQALQQMGDATLNLTYAGG